MHSETSDYSIYRRLVSQLMQGEEQLPSLPTITMDIRRALRDPTTSIAALARLISHDPALSALLIKHASSALHRQITAPKTLLEVINRLGMAEVDRITMVHSIKSLFTLHSAGHKQLFIQAWQRVASTASTCAMLARLLGQATAEHALLAGLLSEIGTLVVLSALRSEHVAPSKELYAKLCNEYSKSLGIIVLKKWSVDNDYIEIIRHTGNWQFSPGQRLQLLDLVNLARYHAIKEGDPNNDLPPLHTLAAYPKLLAPQDLIDENGCLSLLSSHRADIATLTQTLR